MPCDREYRQEDAAADEARGGAVGSMGEVREVHAGQRRPDGEHAGERVGACGQERERNGPQKGASGRWEKRNASRVGMVLHID